MGDSHAAFNYAREATSILPETAYQERFRAWATREVLAKHLGAIQESKEAFQELTYLRQKLPWDQRWWFVFVVPNHADWLLKTGQMQGSEQLLQAQLNVSSSALNGIFLLRLARIALERQDIQKAEQWLDRMEAGKQNLIRLDSYWSVEIPLMSAQLLRQKGDRQTALDVLSEAIRNHHHLGSLAELRTLHLMMAEIWLEQKQYDLAERWIELYARHMEIWPRTFGQPIPKIIEVDLLIAKGRGHEALEILEMLREQGEARGLSGMLVQIHARRAYVYAALGDERAAIRAVRDAEDYSDYALSFVVQGVDTRRFLTQGVSITSDQHMNSSKDQWTLSDREREVLVLVRAGFTNLEIADSLFIARNTVKNHLANIYTRWGIASRQDAVQIAEAKGLLDDNDLL
ncbi:MAG: LuxR C-terminal-related transcriptional regulator [Thermomicrobiales bacterium]|nr:LuxR C-terminal-related transcriptional regulator [Thermomicrobiales bacterium]